MAQDFGNGVSRTLSALQRQFQLVVWQAGKPPLDSELNLAQQTEMERLANVVRSEMPSGWMSDPLNSDLDFVTDPDWSNWFKVGRPVSGDTQPVLWANVNGWVVPVTGSGVVDGDPSNRVNLYPAPSTDARIDLVFLEVWQAQLAPNPSTLNKPSASTLYKWGNSEFGGTNITDDMEDPTIGFETTERVQLQYRLRVVGAGTGLGDSVDLSTFPDGLDDPNVLAQGAASAPLVGQIWANMGDTLGDPGLWRSGNGDASNSLNTVDGYSYAIPLCAVFRRNTTAFVARTGAGNAAQNGSLNRNPYATAITAPVEGTRTFTTVTLTAAIDETDTGAIQVEGLSGSGLDNPDLNWANVFLKLDDEVIYIESVSTTSTPGTITIRAANGRGRNGTQAVPHDAGAKLAFFIFRPDGKTADMITPEDILDLRKSVSPGEWDYQALLAHNLGKLFENSLQSSYKQASGSDTQGPVVLSVDTLWANGGSAVPNQTTALDGPDGIRTIFSDASTVEDASIIMIPNTGAPGSTAAVADFTAAASSWPAAGFFPAGFQSDGDGWTDQTVIELNIGGSDTNGGARATVRTAADNRFVRFVTPREYWLSRDDVSGSRKGGTQTPFQLRFLGESWGDPAGGAETLADHPGPMYPMKDSNFERPYLVLGGVVNSDLILSTAEAIAGGSSVGTYSTVRFITDFDTPGSWFSSAPVNNSALTGITNLLLHGSRNLYDLLTDGGKDPSGESSELYIVLTGSSLAGNTGVFRVIGAGTVGYTTVSAALGTDVVVKRVGEGSANLTAESNLTAEVRSQYTHTEDGSLTGNGASALVVLTDLSAVAGGAASPWTGMVTQPVQTQAVLDTKVLYGPSRGGASRVPNKIDQVALVAAASGVELVREAPTAIDTNFDNEAGVPAGEYYFPSSYLQTWNRLPSLGLAAPYAPAYGDGNYLKENLRECEIFEDRASKTLVIRPFQRTAIALRRNQVSSGTLIPPTYTAGPFGGNVDGGNLFIGTHNVGYSVPWEFMPRFGRQDIPYHQTTGTTGPVFVGINHLFGDSQTSSDDVFRVVGGVSNAAAVESLFIQTGSTSGRDYGEYFAMGASYGYQGRIYEDVNAYSSDLSHKGMKGIQLPPFLGIARVYGVYDRREFMPGGQGAYNSDRVTPSAVAGLPKNLLRTDADKQTLFIVKDGAEDVLPGADAHTYVVPEDVIDIRLSGDYVPSDSFESMEFVVECVVFGFASGFINKNNYVLGRNLLPDGTAVGTLAPLASTVSAILPLPLPYNNQVYTVSTRTVYQGDPYMTRDGATKTVSDYMTRYGQIQQANAFGLTDSIQQYDSTASYSQVPEIPNPRAFEVLASMDFHTTLGTGKISGPVSAGTYTDVGHINNSNAAVGRIPATAADPIWQSESRTFTQPSSNREPLASLELRFLLDTASSSGEVITLRRGDVFKNYVSNTAPWTGASAALSAQSFSNLINNDPEARYVYGVRAFWNGTDSVTLRSTFPGEAGKLTSVQASPVPGASQAATGFTLVSENFLSGESVLSSVGFGRANLSHLILPGEDAPMNGVFGRGTTPIRLGGLTERLPLGILLQDSDFLGEDALRDGASALVAMNSGGSASVNALSPILGSQEYGRIQGSGSIGMADGGIQLYSPWSISNPTGTKLFRIFRGGGSAYVLDPAPAGGPVDFSAGSLPAGSEPVLKGAALAGRAYLVRNYPETAFASSERRSWGGEIQMVVVTEGHVGSGPECGKSYAMDGQISPTGYGKGFAASDRYRLEGKPLASSHGPASPTADISGSLAPYPSEDPAEDPCP